MRYIRGRVLDVGCGAGRVALHLQNRGHEVVAIDPNAIEVARRRGVRDARVMAFTDVSSGLGWFDTAVMLGNNFGLFEDATRARHMLRRLRGMAGRIVATSNDPSLTDDPDHLTYHEQNRRRGRKPGQLRIRVRHGTNKTPWFDYLIYSPLEMT
ncbi:MAG: hypothetical protein QOG33_944, partial [Gaiellales bacterium]|nr:hypothetical protein [Gaiellales bacterium]